MKTANEVQAFKKMKVKLPIMTNIKTMLRLEA